jgi:tellurite resistance protein TehA-like permease
MWFKIIALINISSLFRAYHYLYGTIFFIGSLFTLIVLIIMACKSIKIAESKMENIYHHIVILNSICTFFAILVVIRVMKLEPGLGFILTVLRPTLVAPILNVIFFWQYVTMDDNLSD